MSIVALIGLLVWVYFLCLFNFCLLHLFIYTVLGYRPVAGNEMGVFLVKKVENRGECFFCKKVEN